MQHLEARVSSKWLKASVMGAIWASNEIVLGSFLHNIRVPMSGTIMAFISVALMVSFCELWKEKGLVWRAAIIAALMKSISPSIIILGPMAGIALEGFLMSFGIFLFGMNLAGYMAGGAMAVTAVLIQKVLRLLISYGFNFIEILNNLFIYASKQLNLNPEKGIIIIIVLVGLYVLAGFSGALLGYFGGRTASRMKDMQIASGPTGQAHLFEKSENRAYSIALLIIHLVVIIFGVYLINNFSFWVIIPYLSVYFTLSIIFYKSALRRLRNLTFWIWFIGITLLASYFLGDWQNAKGFNTEGLIEGISMNLRAALILIGFAVISTELKNPVIKVIMYKRGAANLYQGMELAFGILPMVLESFPRTRDFLKQPGRSIAGLINRADELLSHVSHRSMNKSEILIITGEKHQGKTTAIKKIIEELTARGMTPAGFYTELNNADEALTRYNLVTPEDGKEVLFCSMDPDTGTQRYGRYYFSDAALARGKEVLAKAVEDKASIIVIDEIGPLEMSGGGWSPAIELICQGSGIPMIWAVRKSLAIKAARKWDVGDVRIVDLGEVGAADKISQIASQIAYGSLKRTVRL